MTRWEIVYSGANIGKAFVQTPLVYHPINELNGEETKTGVGWMFGPHCTTGPRFY